MAVLGITGSIASGKSTFRDLLARELGADVFDADLSARSFLDGDAAVRSEVSEAFGPAVYGPDGRADREALREVIFSQPEARETLQGILHPRVRANWSALAADPVYSSGRHLLVDIPLLFETNADAILRRVVTVACSPEVQQARLAARGLAPETSARIIATQMPVGEKVRRSTWLVWNDGALDALGAQAARLAGQLGEPDRPLTGTSFSSF